MVPLELTVLIVGAVAKAIDNDLRNNQTEAHRQNYCDGGNAVDDRVTQ
jgi:hypothetical protein